MTTSNTPQKNFIASLFDFGFTTFVTLRFLKIIYTIMVVLILLGGIFFLIAGLQSRNSFTIIGSIIFAPLITLVYLVLARITFEVIAMFFRIGDNTFLAVQLLSGGRAGQWGQGPQPGYGQPGPYGSQAVPNAPWGYGAGAGETAGAPTGSSPYGAGSSPANYGQPQAGYGQSQPSYGQPQDSSGGQYAQPQPSYEKPQDSTGGQYSRPMHNLEKPQDSTGNPYDQSSETPQPGQEGWGPGQTPPSQ